MTNNKLIQLGEIGSDQKSRVYSVEGIVQCISSTCYKDPPKVMVTK